jgi:predicted transcriptional regulator
MAKPKRGTKRKAKATGVVESEVKASQPARLREEGGMVGALSATGMPKGVARTLALLSTAGDWLTSQDIERETRLRQPEVSIAVRELLGRGWIARDAVKVGAKGRPVYTFKMAVDLRQVYDDLRASESERIDAIKGNLDRIRDMWGVK